MNIQGYATLPVLQANANLKLETRKGPRRYRGEFSPGRPELWEAFHHQKLEAQPGYERELQALYPGQKNWQTSMEDVAGICS